MNNDKILSIEWKTILFPKRATDQAIGPVAIEKQILKIYTLTISENSDLSQTKSRKVEIQSIGLENQQTSIK